MKPRLNLVLAGLLAFAALWSARPAQAAVAATGQADSFHTEYSFEQDGTWYLYVSDTNASYTEVAAHNYSFVLHLSTAITVYRLDDRALVASANGTMLATVHARPNAGVPNQQIVTKAQIFYVGQNPHTIRSSFHLVNGQVRMNAYWFDGVRVY
jgi:hypothetical protein